MPAAPSHWHMRRQVLLAGGNLRCVIDRMNPVIERMNYKYLALRSIALDGCCSSPGRMLQLAGGGGLTATGRSALRRDGARVADGRPRRAGMGVVRRRGWGRVWGRKERRWQVAAAPSGSELGAGIGVSLDEGAATACRDWGRESELGAGIGGESREEGAATEIGRASCRERV